MTPGFKPFTIIIIIIIIIIFIYLYSTISINKNALCCFPALTFLTIYKKGLQIDSN